MMMVKRKQSSDFKFQKFSKKQQKLLYFWEKGSPYESVDIVIADGAIRSGKTISMLCSFIRWSMKHYRNQTFIIAGRTIGALKKNVISPMLQILSAWGIIYQYNRSENYIIVGNNIYYMYDASNEKSQDKIQGLTAAGAFADEVALFPKSFVDQMMGRCSVEGAKIFLNCNPGSPYHFVKTDYIDQAKKKNILYLHFTMDDNLSLAKEIKERFKRLFTGVFYQRYILGLWVQAEGIIYDMYSDNIHKVPTMDRYYTEYYVSCDYGTQNATVFLLWGKYKNVWYCIKEYYYSGRDKSKQKSDIEYYQDLVKFVGDYPIKSIIIDPSAASFITLIRKYDKFEVRKANNQVYKGIRNTATCLGQELIKFNDCCKSVFKEFSSYVWDTKAVERGEDKPLKQNDHAMDAIRYFVNTIIMINNKPYDEEIYNKGYGGNNEEVASMMTLAKKGRSVF